LRSRPGEKQRIYESDNQDVFERVSAALDLEAGRFIVAREGPKEVLQQYLVQNGTRTPLTKNQDYTPDVTPRRSERRDRSPELHPPVWARWSAWLDKHVKNPTKSEPRKTTTTEQAQG
jgi:hypothetical protein